MAAIPSPAKPVARSTNEAGSGVTTPKAFAVAGDSIPISIPIAIQYTDFIYPPYFLRRRMMATIPIPAKPVARSTNEAGSGTRGPPVLAFAVAGKSMAAIIQHTDFIHPPVGPESTTTLTKHDSYHECKILKTKLRQRRGCGIVKISCTQVMPSPVKKPPCCESKMLIFGNLYFYGATPLLKPLENI